jgi:hypothetical protein
MNLVYRVHIPARKSDTHSDYKHSSCHLLRALCQRLHTRFENYCNVRLGFHILARYKFTDTQQLYLLCVLYRACQMCVCDKVVAPAFTFRCAHLPALITVHSPHFSY